MKSGVCGPVVLLAEQVAANYPEASGDCATGIVARLQGIVAAVAGEFSHIGPAEQLNASVLQSSNNRTSAVDSIACESECVYSAGMMTVINQYNIPLFTGTLAECYEAFPTLACYDVGEITSGGLRLLDNAVYAKYDVYAQYTESQLAAMSEAEYTALVKANYARLVEEWRR